MKIFMLCAIFALAIADTVYALNTDDDFKELIECFIDKVPCSGENKDVKDIFIEFLEESCKSCDTTSKGIMKLFLQMFKHKAPEEFNTFKKIYDPEDKYVTFFEGWRNE